MHENEIAATAVPKRIPWNKGKLIGTRPPLRQKHVWAIRTRLQIERQVRELALFNLAIDSKLRGCDLVALRVDDVARNGCVIERTSVRQRKTGRPVRFELTEQTRQTIDEYLATADKKQGEYLFNGLRPGEREHVNSAVCAPYSGLAGRDWTRPTCLRHALAAADKGHTDLPPHRQSACSSASAWTHED
jgi:integrase